MLRKIYWMLCSINKELQGIRRVLDSIKVDMDYKEMMEERK